MSGAHTADMIARVALAAAVLVAGCSTGGADGRGTLQAIGGKPSTPPGSCTTFKPPALPARAIGGITNDGRGVSFTPLTGPFRANGSHWRMLQVSPTHPVNVGVQLAHDDGMAIDAISFIMQPYTYQGSDGDLAGAAVHVTRRNLRADGQTITATFSGLDDHGRPLRKGVYKVLVDLLGHRTSSSTCLAQGPVDDALTGITETGVIFGLASIGHAPRPHGS
jgi:hypothetical protein